MKNNQPDTIVQKYYNILELPSYRFHIIYAEHLNGETVEFHHFHPYYEIYYTMSGQMKSEVDDRTYTLYPGDLLFLAPNVKHHTVYEPDVQKEYFVIIFEVMDRQDKQSMPNAYALLLNELREKLDLIEKNEYFITRTGFDATYWLDTIQKEMTGHQIGYSTIVNYIYHHFFILALRTIDSSPSHFEEPPENLNLGLEASKYIHENYFQDITIQSVAEYLNISPRHVNRVFYEMFGTTFTKALTMLRLSYAKKYICSTNLSIEKISALAGFKSPRALYKLFKEQEDMTITEYRKNFKRVPI